MNHPVAEAPPRAAPLYRPWLHALAMLLVLGSFALIAVGGNVTSLDAGMAVPDWPGTFGYNMFLAPIDKWGPNSDVAGAFWEHSHRLIGSAIGVVSIVLAIGLWVAERRRAWLRWLGFGLLGMVIVQGLMGGFRVTENSVLLAAIHGIFGQTVLGVAVLIAAATGGLWSSCTAERGLSSEPADPAWRWEIGLFAACVLLVIIAIFTHVSHSRELIFLTRLEVVAVITAMVLYMAINLARLAPAAWRAWPRRTPGPSSRAAIALLAMLVLQLILGASVRHGGAERAIPDAPLVYGGLVPPVTAVGLAAAEPEPLPFITLGQVWLHYAHRVVALLVCVALAWLLVSLWRRRSVHPAVLPPLVTTTGLTILQVMLGVMTVWSEILPPLATLHQATGAALLAFATWLVIRVLLTADTGVGESAAATAALTVPSPARLPSGGTTA